MNPADHILRAEDWMIQANRPNVSAAPMVSALCVLKALTHATIAQAQIAYADHTDQPPGQ